MSDARESEAKAAAAAFIRAVNAHDLEALAGLMSESHTFVDSGGREVRGRRAMLQAWADYFGLFPDYRIAADLVIAAGATVAVFGSFSGTFRGQKGREIGGPAAWKAVIRGGRVGRWQVYADLSGAAEILKSELGGAARA